MPTHKIECCTCGGHAITLETNDESTLPTYLECQPCHAREVDRRNLEQERRIQEAYEYEDRRAPLGFYRVGPGNY